MIDAHHHLGPEPDYADRLRETAQGLGFTRVVLVGLPAWKWPWATNDHVQAALRRHPDFFTGFAYVEPADEAYTGTEGDGTAAVDRWRDAGFAGLKLIRTRRAYDHPSYIPTYARAAELGMPVLFHTGMVSRTAQDKERDVHSLRLRPAGIDYIARQVPGVKLIMAHLGHPWWDEAGETCRLNDNVLVDLSGPALRVLSPAELKRVLWWDADDDAGHHLAGTPEQGGAWRHVIFGSDVPMAKVGEVLGRYQTAMASLGLPADVQADVLGGTARRVLGLT